MKIPVTGICPYCGKSLSFEVGMFKDLPQAKFATNDERWKHSRKRFALKQRRKDCFVCSQCARIITIIQGKFFKEEDMTESLFNSIECDACGLSIDYRKCYKESYEVSSGYKAYCPRCAWKEWRKRIIFVLSVFLIVYILLYFLMGNYPHLPSLRLW